MDGKTIRVRGVPTVWDVDRLKSYLRAHGVSKNPQVHSLALDIDGYSKHATITFEEGLDGFRTPLAGHPINLDLRALEPGVSTHRLTLDVDFIGMTTLFTPPAKDHKVDIVAITGLAGHAFGSFKERGGDCMWLRDMLPRDMISGDNMNKRPIARILTYGYTSPIVGSSSTQDLDALGSFFRRRLEDLANEPLIRPIVFVSHSLGGLIIKQALIFLAKSSAPKDKRLLHAVSGLIFIGVPHDGMDIDSLVPMVGDDPTRALIESISRLNTQCSKQQQEYHTLVGCKQDYDMFCFYETEHTQRPEKDESGAWKRIGSPALWVTKSSATRCQPCEGSEEYSCSIPRSHSDMIKFGRYDDDYKAVRNIVHNIVKKAEARSWRAREQADEGVIGFSRGQLNENVPAQPFRQSAKRRTENSSSQAENKTERRTTQCYRCGYTNHLLPYCEVPVGKVLQVREYRREEDVCINCGRDDHWKMECDYPDLLRRYKRF